MTTKVAPCTCAHKWQDKQYGTGLRLHNALAKSKLLGKQQWRCTVCAAVQ